jgi:choline dehydrogenase-like flavoprotein
MSVKPNFDAVVIGTGFGGAVTACRLVEAGFRTCVLERGRRYGPGDFPQFRVNDFFGQDERGGHHFTPPPELSHWLWDADHGIFDVRDLTGAVAIQAAGYGGGSLVYANVHLRPPRDVFDHGWAEEYRNGELDPYFDLAAYMLQVAPIPQRLAKTLQHKSAASVFSQDPAAWFRPPLAVTFDGAGGDNSFGRPQQPCDMRGRCCVGCDRQAKNTLDLNYLARAEDGNQGRNLPDIRTMAEVVRIEKLPDGTFLVAYRDLILEGDPEASRQAPEREVTAEYVFVCAGSVGTTELLWRNERRIWKDGAPRPKALGSHYFTNASSISMVFNAEEPHEPDYGPTITAAMVYRRDEPNIADNDLSGSPQYSLDFIGGAGETPRAGMLVRSGGVEVGRLSHDPVLDWGEWKDEDAVGALVIVLLDNSRGLDTPDLEIVSEQDSSKVARVTARSLTRHKHWFLVEDGGYPPEIEGLLNVFRSPLWIRRNRFLEPNQEAEAGFVPARATSPRARLDRLARAVSNASRSSVAAQGTVFRSFNLTRSLSSTFGSVATSGAQSRRLLGAGILGDDLSALLPRQLAKALRKDGAELLDQAAAQALPMFGRVMQAISETAARQVDEGVIKRLASQKVSLPLLRDLFRGLLRQGIQILAGSEAEVARQIVDVVIGPAPLSPGHLLDHLSTALLWTLDYGDNEGHSAMLLMMGRDLHRGKLELAHGNMIATLPDLVLDSASVMQERIARSFATSWNGELRTSPAAAPLGVHLTVHSQGGCPMGGSSAYAVTKPCGEVYGCDGLYVMDAAAFPTSVGVNPSATIAAVAEYKIQQFIREKKKDPHWETPDKEKARGWVDEQGRSTIDPLNHLPAPTSPEPKGRPIDLEFKEQMNGFLAGVTEPPSRWNDLDSFVASGALAPFREAETQGIVENNEVTVTLTAGTPDLARLVSPATTIERPKFFLTGTISFSGGAACQVEKGSYLQVFLPPKQSGIVARFFRYHILYQRDRKAHVMDGVKVLQASPGFDLWHDTATLYVEDRTDTQLARGILRVPVDVFLKTQLPSIKVTEATTQDAARQSWAIAAFGKYFARELWEVYKGRAAHAVDMLVKLITDVHV